MVPATVCVAAPNCQMPKMAQPTQPLSPGSENLGLHINKKMSKSPEFGPVT